jgi:hypothetical protein
MIAVEVVLMIRLLVSSGRFVPPGRPMPLLRLIGETARWSRLFTPLGADFEHLRKKK